MITTHPAFSKLQEQSKKTGKNIYDLLGERLETMMKEKGAETLSTSD
jgi:myo-inositol-hexaphosphate 3-phosphohydrolase